MAFAIWLSDSFLQAKWELAIQNNVRSISQVKSDPGGRWPPLLTMTVVHAVSTTKITTFQVSKSEYVVKKTSWSVKIWNPHSDPRPSPLVPAGRPVVDDPRFFFLAPSSALRSSLCSHHERRREEAQFCVGALPHRMWAGPCARAWDTGVSLICICFCICICICLCRWWPTASMECLERSDFLWLKYFVRSKHGLDCQCQLDQDHHERGEGRRMFSLWQQQQVVDVWQQRGVDVW